MRVTRVESTPNPDVIRVTVVRRNPIWLRALGAPRAGDVTYQVKLLTHTRVPDFWVRPNGRTVGLMRERDLSDALRVFQMGASEPVGYDPAGSRAGGC